MNEAAAMRANLRQMIGQMIAGVGHLRSGLVTTYDPEAYRVKVELQPEAIETGWMPIVSLMSGAGFGVYAAPSLQDEALVVFLEGDAQVPVCLGFLNNVQETPPIVQAGEIVVSDKAGSTLVFTADGKVTLTPQAGFFVNGDITATGTITGQTDVIGAGKHLKTHVHSGVQTGSGNSGQPV